MNITHAFNQNLGMLIPVLWFTEAVEERETGMEDIYIIRTDPKIALTEEVRWLRTVTHMGQWVGDSVPHKYNSN